MASDANAEPAAATPSPSGTPAGLSGGDDRRRASQPPVGGPQPSLVEQLREWLDRLLVADVFLVLAGAVWFGTAVLLHSRGIDAPLQLFQRLWEPLFTPAIGLLMAAALISGALGWWQRRGRRADGRTGS